MEESRIQSASALRETYLAEVSGRLHGCITPLEVYETVQEMRLHLDAMAAAHEELGLDSVEAMRASLAKFGEAQQLGAGLASTISPGRDFRVPIPFLQSFVLCCVFGALFLCALDVWFVASGQFRVTGFCIDCEVGGGIGGILSIFGSIFRRWPWRVGLVACAAANLLLALTLDRTYLALGRIAVLEQLLVSISVAVFALGSASAWLATALVKANRNQLPVLALTIQRPSPRA